MGVELDMTELDSQQEILATFQGLQTLLDSSLKLSPDPRNPKRRKEHGPAKDDAVEQQAPNLLGLSQMLHMVARLAPRHEQEITGWHQSDTFMLFCNKVQPTGILQTLVKETQSWKAQLETKTLATMPLRQHLLKALLTDLLNRVTKISKSSPEDEVVLLMKQKGLLTEELSWPYLQWDPKVKALRQTSKKPVTMAKLMQHLEELLEMVRDPTAIVRFHALNPQSTQDVIVWRLQICLRRDELWDLLMQLTFNSMWALIGTTFKVHSPRPSQLAQSLQTMLHTPTRKGTGKGKKGAYKPKA